MDKKIYGPGDDDYGRAKSIAPGGCVKSDTSTPIDLSEINIPATSVPPQATPVPNLTSPLITDHVFSGSQYGPFTACGYCQGHYAKHLYQSSANVYHSVPYDPNPWFPTYPNYPVITWSADTYAATDETNNKRPPTFTTGSGSCLPS